MYLFVQPNNYMPLYVFNIRNKMLFQISNGIKNEQHNKFKIISLKNFMNNRLDKKNILFSTTDQFPKCNIPANNGTPFIYYSENKFLDLNQLSIPLESMDDEGYSSDDYSSDDNM